MTVDEKSLVFSKTPDESTQQIDRLRQVTGKIMYPDCFKKGLNRSKYVAVNYVRRVLA